MSAKRGVLTHNVVALRAEPKSGSELVSQALLGETITWEEEQEGFVWATTPDAYSGWIWGGHLRPYRPKETYWTITGTIHTVMMGMVPLRTSPNPEADFETQLTLGTSVRLLSTEAGWSEVEVPANTESGYQTGYLPAKTTRLPAVWQGFDGYELIYLARQFMGTPYLWGGGTPFGFDCSGLVQRLYAIQGILLPRDAHQQAASPLLRRLDPEEPLGAADLVFFCGDHDPRNRGITHVGLAIEETHFIHASGKEGVNISPFIDPYYARTYRFACRLR